MINKQISKNKTGEAMVPQKKRDTNDTLYTILTFSLVTSLTKRDKVREEEK